MKMKNKKIKFLFLFILALALVGYFIYSSEQKEIIKTSTGQIEVVNSNKLWNKQRKEIHYDSDGNIEKELVFINDIQEGFETYYFPMDFLRTGTFGEYIEASQLEMNTEYLKNGRFDILPEQMAILCKRVDEEVDLDDIDGKAKSFRRLTMDIVWEFAFFLNNRSIKSLEVMQTFLGVEQKA